MDDQEYAELKKRMKADARENAMPKVLLAICLLFYFFVLALLTFVIPAFSSMFESFGGTLPPLTQAVVSISQILVNYWYVAIPIFLSPAILLVRIYRHSKKRNLYLSIATATLVIAMMSILVAMYLPIFKMARIIGE